MGKSSVWSRPAKRSQPPLQRDEIVAAAIVLLDEDGVAGLTMRKLATRLGTAPMTLYGHVSTKDDLLEYVLDAVFAEALDEAAPAGDWRADLARIASRTFDALIRHPWAPALVGGRPPIGPAAVTQFGTVLRVLTDAGLTAEQRDAATAAVYYYVLGAALAESAWRSAGWQEDALVAEAASVTPEAASTSAPTRDFLRRQAGGDARRRFEQGLHCVLNGVGH
jgi:AcrR family transcriptional regulator